MTDYPFSSDQIQNHRFHGVISGRLTCINDRLILLTSWGEIPLFYPHRQKRGFYAAKKNWENNPDDLLHVYGFPKTNPYGLITSMQLVSFHRDGTMPTEDQNLLPFSRRFKSGQFWICGRVRSASADGMTVIRVKQMATPADQKSRYWLVTGRSIERPIKGSKTLFLGFHDDRGRLVLQPERMLTPPNQKTRLSPSSPSPRERFRGSTASRQRSASHNPLSTSPSVHPIRRRVSSSLRSAPS